MKNENDHYFSSRRTAIKVARGIFNVVRNPLALPFIVVPVAMEGMRRLTEKPIPENFATLEGGAFVVLGLIFLASIVNEIGKAV